MTGLLRIGDKRVAHFGPCALARLRSVLSDAPFPDAVLLVSPSFDAAQHERITASAGRRLDTVVIERSLDRDGMARLAGRVERNRVVIGVGGGSVMDAAKAMKLWEPDRHVVLVPMTLSGSEHSPTTSWWEGGQKRITWVGLADAVVSDPQMLISDLNLNVSGAFHCLAHTLAAVTLPVVPEPLKQAAAAGARDLVAGIDGSDGQEASRYSFMRGAWKASVSFISSGPAIGFHHWTVHATAPPGTHALVSSYLLCAGLTGTDLYDSGVDFLGQADPCLPTAIRSLAARWHDRLAALLPPLSPPSSAAPFPLRERVARLSALIP